MSSETTFASDTSKRTPKEWIFSLLILLVGLTIAHLGVTLFLVSELGTDTFTVFIQGLSFTFGLSIGTMHVIVLCILTAVMFFFTKGYVKPGTIVCAFCGGPIIDFFLWVFDGRVSAASPLYLRCLAMTAGLVILALGMSIVINSQAGTGPNDLVAMILTDKLGRFQFRWVRMACDFFFVAAGFLLGGVAGPGTIVAVLLTGSIVQFWLPRTKKLLKL